MIRSLFLKIFLWFGTIVITVIVGTYIAGEVNRHREPPIRQPFDQLLDNYAQEAARQFEAGGDLPDLLGDERAQAAHVAEHLPALDGVCQDGGARHARRGV